MLALHTVACESVGSRPFLIVSLSAVSLSLYLLSLSLPPSPPPASCPFPSPDPFPSSLFAATPISGPSGSALPPLHDTGLPTEAGKPDSARLPLHWGADLALVF